MAVVGLKSNAWLNNDGLYIPQGSGGVVTNKGGEKDADGRHWTEVTIDLTALPTVASGNKQIVADNVIVPAGAFIEQVDVLVTKETDGTNANLDVGFVKLDRSTELDFNGLLAAADAFNAGTDLGTLTTYVVGSTEVGALVGTKLAYNGLITANAETADWTAGVVKVRIFWHVPLSADL